MDKEYISTIVIDSESAAKTWRDLPSKHQEESDKDDKDDDYQGGEFSGVHTWVS